MKNILYTLALLTLQLHSSAQLTEEFNSLDKTKSFKGAAFHTALSLYIKKLDLLPLDSFKYEFRIRNKQYLQIDSLSFESGKAVFVSDLLFQIVLETSNTDSIQFNNNLHYLTRKFGKPKELALRTKRFFEWRGTYLTYQLQRELNKPQMKLEISCRCGE